MIKSGKDGDRTNEGASFRLIVQKLSPLFLRPDLQLVILFGSQAGGKTRAESDVDLAIQGDGPLDLVALATEVIRLLQRSDVDLIDLRRAGPLLKMEVVRGGKLLFEKSPGLYLAFCSLATCRYIDTRKLREARKEGIDRFLEQRGLS